MPPLKMWMGSEEFKDQDRAWGQGEEAFRWGTGHTGAREIKRVKAGTIGSDARSELSCPFCALGSPSDPDKPLAL